MIRIVECLSQEFHSSLSCDTFGQNCFQEVSVSVKDMVSAINSLLPIVLQILDSLTFAIALPPLSSSQSQTTEFLAQYTFAKQNYGYGSIGFGPGTVEQETTTQSFVIGWAMVLAANSTLTETGRFSLRHL